MQIYVEVVKVGGAMICGWGNDMWEGPKCVGLG